jgi:two-component system phosphate regulon sensor histidine kinase PhoR
MPGLRVAAVTLLVAVVGLVALEVHSARQERTALVERLRQAVDALAPEAAPLFNRTPEAADAEIRQWAVASGLRVTLIAADGRVHADSWTLPALLGRLDNHLQRPEVVTAQHAEVGVSYRRSVTTNRPTAYVAHLVGPVERPLGYLRLAQEEMPRRWLVWWGVVIALLSAVAAGTVAQRLAKRNHEAVARHLEPWVELPRRAELAAMAEEADRHFRATRELLTRELRTSRLALDGVGEGVLLLDREGVVRFANATATHLLGRDATGHALVEAVRAPELLAAVREVLEHRSEQHTSVSEPMGEEMAVRVAELRDPVLAASVVMHDLRQERQLERARRALVADLAHELRTPLTVLSGLVEELRERGSEDELAGTLSRQVDKLRVFVAEMEELSRIESGEVRLEPEELEVISVVRQVLGDLRTVAAAADVELVPAGEPALLRTDRVRLAQVLNNVVDNGIRYNRPGGHVHVRTQETEAGVRIEVEDDGLGIPADEIELVFQRFYRVRRRAEREGGSGLGLAIVKHLVRALGGTVNLASHEGKGTTVTLAFPRDVSKEM